MKGLENIVTKKTINRNELDGTGAQYTKSKTLVNGIFIQLEAIDELKDTDLVSLLTPVVTVTSPLKRARQEVKVGHTNLNYNPILDKGEVQYIPLKDVINLFNHIGKMYVLSNDFIMVQTDTGVKKVYTEVESGERMVKLTDNSLKLLGFKLTEEKLIIN